MTSTDLPSQAFYTSCVSNKRSWNDTLNICPSLCLPFSDLFENYRKLPLARLVKSMSQTPFQKEICFAVYSVICPNLYRFTKHSFWLTTSQVSHSHGPNSAAQTDGAQQAVWAAAAAATAASWPYRTCSQVKVSRGAETAPGRRLTAISQCNAPLGKKQKLLFQLRCMPNEYSSLSKCLFMEWWKALHQSSTDNSLAVYVV